MGYGVPFFKGNTMNSINQSLPILASWYADKFGVPVVLDSSARTEHTDGKSVTVPLINFEELTHLSQEELTLTKNAVFGWLAHGCMHVRSTDFSVGHELSKQQFAWLNLLEDARIERAAIRIWPGTLETLSALSEYLIKKDLYLLNPMEANDFSHLLFHYSLYKVQSEVAEHDCLSSYASTFRNEIINQVGDDFIDGFDQILLTTKDTTSTEEVLDVVYKIFAYIQEQMDDEQEEGQEQKQDDNSGDAQGSESQKDESPNDGRQGENQDENQNGSNQSDSSEEGQEKSNANNQNSSGKEQGDSNDSQQSNNQGDNGQDENQNQSGQDSSNGTDGNQSQDQNQEKSENSNSENGQDDQDSDSKTGQQQSQADSQGQSQPQPSSSESKAEKLSSVLNNTEGFKAEKAFDNLGKEFNNLVVKSSSRTAPRTFSLTKEKVKDGWASPRDVAEAKSQSNVLTQRLRALVEAQNRVNSRLVRNGKDIQKSKLHQARLGNFKIFRKEEQKKMPNTAVTLLLDTSYSMARTIIKAQQACLGLALALQPIKGVKTSVNTFGTTDNGDYTPLVKEIISFDQTPSTNIGKFFSTRAKGSTPLTEGLWSVGVDLVKRKEDRKVLFVITDGMPDNPDSAREIIKKLEASNITLIGIGMGQEASKTGDFFKTTVLIKDVSELNGALFNIISNQLLNY